MIITLYRDIQDRFGMHGHVEDETGAFLCYTVERPWLDNAHNVSCIPEGSYLCEPHIKSNNGQHCWILDNVPGRQGVLIHTGNTENDSEGCIIVGADSTTQGVAESELALQTLKNKLPSNFTLRITSTAS